jgi:hypothetical protein
MRDPEHLTVHRVMDALKIPHGQAVALIESGALGAVIQIGWRKTVRACAVEAYRAELVQKQRGER